MKDLLSFQVIDLSELGVADATLNGCGMFAGSCEKGCGCNMFVGNCGAGPIVVDEPTPV